MTREEVYVKLNDVFREVFGDDSLEVNDSMTVDDDTTADDIDDWDSLEHINLMVAIENKFHITFSMGEINSFKNVGEMVNVILKKAR